MAADSVIEGLAKNLQSLLHIRFASASYPTPVLKSYDSSNDLYLTVAANANTNAIIKFERETARTSGATDMFGNAQRVYCPHVIKCLFETGAAASSTITLSSPTAGVRASGTATLSSTVATDVLTVEGIDFTAVDADPGTNEFLVGASDTETAANLAAAINAAVNVEIDGIVTASSALAVVTVQAVAYGTSGNALTLAETGDSITLSGATLAGGVAGETVVINGVTFYLVDASDGTANQFVEGASDTLTAAALAAAVNASTSTGIPGVVTASSALAVVTVTAVEAGLSGNGIVITGDTGLVVVAMSGGTAIGCPESTKAVILSECSRVGTKLMVYQDAGIAVADVADSTKLVVEISNLPNGLMAHV